MTSEIERRLAMTFLQLEGIDGEKDELIPVVLYQGTAPSALGAEKERPRPVSEPQGFGEKALW